MKALKSFNDCLAIIRKIGRNDYFLKALTMRKMGEIYAKRHEHKNALECFQEAIKVYSNQETGYNLDIAYILLDVAFIFYHQGKYEKVLLCCSANISVFERGKDEMEITAILGKCLGLKAIAHDELNDSDVAMEFYDKSIEAFRAYLSKSAQGTSKEKLQEKSIFLASSCARKARLHERLNQDSMAIKQYSCKCKVLLVFLITRIIRLNHVLFPTKTQSAYIIQFSVRSKIYLLQIFWNALQIFEGVRESSTKLSF